MVVSSSEVFVRLALSSVLLCAFSLLLLALSLPTIYNRASREAVSIENRAIKFKESSSSLWKDFKEVNYGGKLVFRKRKQTWQKRCRMTRCPQGPQGEAGEAAPDGRHGMPGQPGPPGPDGEDVEALFPPEELPCTICPEGPIGPTGVEGDGGIIGYPGMRGETGEDGRDGRAGEDGLPGNCGGKGFPGNPGYRGERGSDAVQGEGVKGLKGEPGPRGPLGRVGQEGRRAKRDGYTGMMGEPGPVGETGNPGIQGPPGMTGGQGDSGPARDYCMAHCGASTSTLGSNATVVPVTRQSPSSQEQDYSVTSSHIPSKNVVSSSTVSLTSSHSQLTTTSTVAYGYESDAKGQNDATASTTPQPMPFVTESLSSEETEDSPSSSISSSLPEPITSAFSAAIADNLPSTALPYPDPLSPDTTAPYDEGASLFEIIMFEPTDAPSSKNQEHDNEADPFSVDHSTLHESALAFGSPLYSNPGDKIPLEMPSSPPSSTAPSPSPTHSPPGFLSSADTSKEKEQVNIAVQFPFNPISPPKGNDPFSYEPLVPLQSPLYEGNGPRPTTKGPASRTVLQWSEEVEEEEGEEEESKEESGLPSPRGAVQSEEVEEAGQEESATNSRDAVAHAAPLYSLSEGKGPVDVAPSLGIQDLTSSIPSSDSLFSSTTQPSSNTTLLPRTEHTIPTSRHAKPVSPNPSVFSKKLPARYEVTATTTVYPYPKSAVPPNSAEHVTTTSPDHSASPSSSTPPPVSSPPPPPLVPVHVPTHQVEVPSDASITPDGLFTSMADWEQTMGQLQAMKDELSRDQAAYLALMRARARARL